MTVPGLGYHKAASARGFWLDLLGLELFDADTAIQALLEDLPKAWALRTDEGEPELVWTHLRAAYGRGYMAGLEHRCGEGAAGVT